MTRGRGGGRRSKQGIHIRSEEEQYENISEDLSGSGTDNVENTPVTDNLSSQDVLTIELGKMWFDEGKVVGRVTQSIKNYYHHPYLNWKETPRTIRDHWFNNFRGLCTWNPAHETAVRRDYDEMARLRLKDTVYDAGSKVKGKDKPCPGWMQPEVYKAFLERRMDKQFRNRSKQASLNKKCAEEGPSHHYGSIKAIKHAAKMERYEKLLNDYKEKGEEVTPDKAWFEAVGGYKKDHVYGLGTAASLYYNTPPKSTGKLSSTSSNYVPGLLTQVEAQRQNVEELQKETEEHRKFREEARLREEMYLKTQEQMSQQLAALS
ncbi:hypothetical protein RND81_06G180000 [Saponaria officinalis]|uniref:Transposase, Ptta/En/Spm, plant n=1 Tax=Saponaria officinalis TaxID=3572 RepID=A0AAW1KBA3_SAPOF